MPAAHNSRTSYIKAAYRLTSFLLMVTIVFLAACSSPVPELIRLAPVPDQIIPAVNTRALSKNTEVRWGGSILTTENLAQETQITVIAYPLDSDGKPLPGDMSSGRFIAKLKGFIEPQLYQRDRLITVRGKITGYSPLQIGEFSYDHAVVNVEQLYLWPKRKEHDDIEDAYWWRSPWYHPYYHPYFPMRY